jgi:hypothetical protein
VAQETATILVFKVLLAQILLSLVPFQKAAAAVVDLTTRYQAQTEAREVAQLWEAPMEALEALLEHQHKPHLPMELVTEMPGVLVGMRFQMLNTKEAAEAVLVQSGFRQFRIAL